MGNPFKDAIDRLQLLTRGRPSGSPRIPLGGGLSTALKRAQTQPPASITPQPGAANLIQTPDIARKLVTRYGIREKNPTPTIAPEVVGVVLVDDLIGESDIIVPRIRPACGFATIAPVAQTAAMQLQNPFGSNTILHVYYLVLQTSALTDVFVRSHGIVDALAPGGGSSGFRNTLLANQISVGQCAAAVNPAAFGGVQIARFRLSTSNPVLIPFDHVMDPAHILTVEATVAFTGTISCDYFWSEEPTER